MIPITVFMHDMFPDEVSVREILTRDGDGTPLTYSDPLVLKARCKGGDRNRFMKDGKEIISTAHAVFDGVFGLTEDFEYTLPPRFNPRQPTPIRVSKPTDENKPHHEIVFFS